MKFALLLYADLSQAPQYTPEERAVAQQSWFTLVDEMKATGVYVENYGYSPVAKAKTVRIRNGKTVTTDGPVVETTEDLNGYFLLDCKDIDEAIGWAAKSPYASGGSIEVRPVIAYTEDMVKKAGSDKAYQSANG
jgi:hypothetical protein